MSRRPRTGFAWAATPDEPFISVSWDYRTGPLFNLRGLPAARAAAVITAVVVWVLILHGCGNFA